MDEVVSKLGLTDEQKEVLRQHKESGKRGAHHNEKVIAELETGYLFHTGDGIVKFRADVEHDTLLLANEDAKQIAAQSTNGLPGDRRPARLGY